MARKKNQSETDYWLIPKRSSIHQVWCLIDGIKARGVNGRGWTPALQNDLGVNLKKWGATNDGRNVSHQAMRTLTAFAQYLGFVYIDTTTTPSVIRITEAGNLFWSNNKPHIHKLRNLKVDESKSLQQSDDVCFQLEKLQLTNPIEEKKCTNILLFPFRTTLRLLIELEYLDVEELAMYLFTMRDDSEYEYVKQQIELFRALPLGNRRALVNAFRGSVLGNISLVKAPSTGYYITICERTGLITRQREVVSNSGRKVTTMRFQEGAKEYATNILSTKYIDILPYDFGDNLRLWIDYFGNPNRIATPFDATVTNKTNDRLLVSISDSTNYVNTIKILEPSQSVDFPAFDNDSYTVNLFSVIRNQNLTPILFKPTNSERTLQILADTTDASKVESLDAIRAKILEHIEARTFAGEMALLLKAITLQTGIDKESDKMLRGAYLESLFYELLRLLEKQGKVKEVVWNGRYNEMGLPSPAPGGKNGTPDLTFVVDDNLFVLELTTIKSKSGQEKAESTSVPDHVRLAASQTTLPVKGIFAAPVVHQRVSNMIKATAEHNGNDIACITIETLLTALTDKSNTLLENLLSL